MANDLNAQKGTYVASEWKDGTGEGNYTPITPDRMNHIEKGVQSNSEDLKKLGDAWDSAYQLACGTESPKVLEANGHITFDFTPFAGTVPKAAVVTPTCGAGFSSSIRQRFRYDEYLYPDGHVGVIVTNLTETSFSVGISWIAIR